MSIVESTLQRLKGARSAEPEKRPVPAPEPIEPPTAARARTRIPTPVRWPVPLAPADFDVARLRDVGLSPPERFASRLRDDYRAIRREVVTASEEKVGATGSTVGPIVAVTSAGPGEGKSYTALNLALSIAGQGVHDVLLIDADFIKRTITMGCNLGDRAGLAELLGNSAASFFEYAYPTRTPRLRILPTGTRAHASHDLFASARVATLFDTIRTAMAEHIVIVDTPPILVSSDTPVVVDVAGQVLLVVRAGKTLQDSVRDAVGHIRKALPVGVILNYWSPLLPSEKKTYTSYDEYAQ
jgi:capsular exopolysaccharide synthesis family protein